MSAALYDPRKARTGAGTQGSTAALQIDCFPAPPQLVPAREAHNICQPPPLETHNVPQHLVGRIIGRSGANINQIRQSSGAVVDVQDLEDGVTAIVTLQGSDEARAKARAAIDILILAIVLMHCSCDIGTRSRIRSIFMRSRATLFWLMNNYKRTSTSAL